MWKPHWPPLSSFVLVDRQWMEVWHLGIVNLCPGLVIKKCFSEMWSVNVQRQCNEEGGLLVAVEFRRSSSVRPLQCRITSQMLRIKQLDLRNTFTPVFNRCSAVGTVSHLALQTHNEWFRRIWWSFVSFVVHPQPYNLVLSKRWCHTQNERLLTSSGNICLCKTNFYQHLWWLYVLVITRHVSCSG